ncbi:hypothetical protein C8R44DRAFT_876629 [Mycena epipterygia]|nr:hypothetical protein C8R44DRAFT_876629 [Mycena epipterygia]
MEMTFIRQAISGCHCHSHTADPRVGRAACAPGVDDTDAIAHFDYEGHDAAGRAIISCRAGARNGRCTAQVSCIAAPSIPAGTTSSVGGERFRAAGNNDGSTTHSWSTHSRRSVQCSCSRSLSSFKCPVGSYRRKSPAAASGTRRSLSTTLEIAGGSTRGGSAQGGTWAILYEGRIGAKCPSWYETKSPHSRATGGKRNRSAGRSRS